ncbi:poly(A) polymerase small subunit VP39 [Adoxophyes honmai entomopoxvirus 'L']|uniref:Cap-specific mRNA (nucleoside-2'-O-)-methyltransferase n=1 Tax=Adoxophyes honmai entomopoxvirus 'L' TaxID=1293540 RepID=A0A916NWQ0_9POXV|nr:poly(A) polymerase small subunit VP39 [Adoxophyes honmai entomopoxvirus 'L']CCU55378.1 poly(A) polymerase small subunit VP39 [Adoxophyes honmai entomopoxvirus 'L']
MSFNPLYYYISDINHEIEYDKNFIPNYKFNFTKQGQMKLLLNEIRFLSEDVEIHKNYKNTDINILYIGSGKGYHIPFLINLYAHYDITWNLYDPVGHCGKLYSMAKNNKKIIINDTIFKKSDVENYKNVNNLLFISDIRTVDNDKIEPTTKNLVYDYDIQNYIIEVLKPISMVKQRDPFPDDWDDLYDMRIPINNKEYIQCFQKYDSAEYRIFIPSITTFVKVTEDLLKSRSIDKKLAWYNKKYRFRYENDYKIAYRVLNKYLKSENKSILQYNNINSKNIKNVIKNISKNIN